MALITFHKTIEKLTNPIKITIENSIYWSFAGWKNIYKSVNKHAYAMEYTKKRIKNSIL